jgi:hypothetical protein
VTSNLYVRAINHSTQIGFSDLPLIHETGITEATGAFGTNAFLETLRHRNEPVGTPDHRQLLQAGQGPSKVACGRRSPAANCASVREAQPHRQHRSISSRTQARATLRCKVIQPLLMAQPLDHADRPARFRGRMHEFIRQSEPPAEVARTYWALYAARVTYLQKAKLIDETARIADELKARQKVDAQKSQPSAPRARWPTAAPRSSTAKPPCETRRTPKSHQRPAPHRPGLSNSSPATARFEQRRRRPERRSHRDENLRSKLPPTRAASIRER